MKLNDIEKEIVLLKAVKELIETMVNYEIMELLGDDPDTEMRCISSIHQQFFNVILVDFLSCTDGRVIGEKTTFLKLLEKICRDPNFDQNNSISNLRHATQEFIDWLETEVIINKIWLPSINLETELNIKRIEFIRICGNVSKHNFSRLGSVAHEIKEIFNRNNHILGDEEALLVIDDFYEWFHTDIFSYHCSAIAEFLNNIRWGIYEYLQPELQQSIDCKSDGKLYKCNYTYPNGVDNLFSKRCYWDLMNEIRSKPYMRRFQVTRYLKMSY